MRSAALFVLLLAACVAAAHAASSAANPSNLTPSDDVGALASDSHTPSTQENGNGGKDAQNEQGHGDDGTGEGSNDFASCSYEGEQGVCLTRKQCRERHPRASLYSSREGASGCESFPGRVKCCVLPPNHEESGASDANSEQSSANHANNGEREEEEEEGEDESSTTTTTTTTTEEEEEEEGNTSESNTSEEHAENTSEGNPSENSTSEENTSEENTSEENHSDPSSPAPEKARRSKDGTFFLGENAMCPMEYSQVFEFGEALGRGMKCLVCERQLEVVYAYQRKLAQRAAGSAESVLMNCFDYTPPPHMQVLFPQPASGEAKKYWHESCCLSTHRLTNHFGYTLESWKEKRECAMTVENRRTCQQPVCNELFPECESMWDEFGDQHRAMLKEANYKQHQRECELCLSSATVMRWNAIDRQFDQVLQHPCTPLFMPRADTREDRIMDDYLCEHVSTSLVTCDLSKPDYQVSTASDICLGCNSLCSRRELDEAQKVVNVDDVLEAVVRAGRSASEREALLPGADSSAHSTEAAQQPQEVSFDNLDHIDRLPTMFQSSPGPQAAINLLRRSLIACGAASVQPTGPFDDKLTDEIKALQTSKGLRADGSCGPITWQALASCEGAPSSAAQSDASQS